MALGRDLINTPANAMGPEELTAAALSLCARFAGESVVHSGPALMQEYPLIAAVGAGSAACAAADRLPLAASGRGARSRCRQGVCFDSGDWI